MRFKVWSSFTQNRLASGDSLRLAVKAGKEYARESGHGFWITRDGKEAYRSPAPAATPPIAAEADTEYQTRISADQVTWQFTDALRPKKPQASIEDLPLFGGERQEDLF